MTVTPEQLDEANKVIRKTKLELMIADGTVFFSALLANLKMIINEQHRYGATDGVRLWLNPLFCLILPPAELLFLILHEIMHCALQHMDRRATANLDLRIHGMAADYYINLYLVKLGYTMIQPNKLLPTGGLLDYKYDGMSTLQIYEELMKDPPEDDGSFTQDIVIGGADDGSEDNDGMTQDDIAEAAITNVAKAVMQADLSGDPGSIPGDVRTMLEDILNPKLPWEAIFQNHMSQHAKDDYSMSRPNKRYMPDFYLPVMKSDALNAMMLYRDTSGSMHMEWLEALMAEMTYIWDVLKPISFRILDGDTAIRRDITYAIGDEFAPLEIYGGGGTELHEFIDEIRKNSPEIAVVFSDGEFDIPDLSNLYTDLIWIIINDPDWTASYGTVIHFEDYSYD
jgi:predicted metal-dependent peptidase